MGLFNSGVPAAPQIGQTMNLLRVLRSARDPQALAAQLIRQNPAMRQALEYVQANGGDPKAAAEKLAAERGVDLNALLGG